MNYIVYQSSDDNLGAIEHQLYTVPFVNAEFAYEDSGAGKKLPHHVDTDTFRHRLWNAAMDGQYVTFGNTGTYGGKFPVDAKYLDSQGARQMTVWYDFFAGTRHWELEPYFDVDGGRALALSPGGEEEESVEYIVYVEKPQKPVEILVEKHKYEVSWINPITGERTKEKDCKAERCSATPPDNAHDWVLHVERQGKKAGMHSYKFESRPVFVQEVEQNPQKSAVRSNGTRWGRAVDGPTSEIRRESDPREPRHAEHDVPLDRRCRGGQPGLPRAGDRRLRRLQVPARNRHQLPRRPERANQRAERQGKGLRDVQGVSTGQVGSRAIGSQYASVPPPGFDRLMTSAYPTRGYT